MPYAEGQEYCLECGSRLPASGGLIVRLGTGWRRRLGWYPGDWIWPTLAALVIAAAAGAASAIWLTDRSSANDQTLVETTRVVSTQQTTNTAPEPTTSATTVTTPTGTTGPPPPPPPPRPTNTPITWPAGRGGWTIVLDSLPSTNSRPAALVEARQAIHLGMKKVGVLDSSEFSSLHPVYLVIFYGIYNTEADAQSAIINAHQHGYRAAYPRRITP